MKIVLGGSPSEAILSKWKAAHPSVEFVVAQTAEEQAKAMPGATAYLGYIMHREGYLAGRATLKWVHATSAGVERIVNIPELVASDVILTNTRGGHANCIAEHTFAMLLALTRQLFPSYEDQKKQVWDRPGISGPSREIGGATMVILGMGNIGRQIARRAAAFDLRVIGVDLRTDNVAPGVEKMLPLDQLDEGLKLADIFVVTLPITPETYHLIDARRLALLHPDDYLIVVSRGGIIEESALIDALKNGKLAGAGLDVQETEPLPAGDPLWQAPNLIMTPHSSAASRQTGERVWAITTENLNRFLAGQPLENVCDKKAGF